MTDQHKRITKAQFELWEQDPVTKAFCQCLTWEWENMRDRAGEPDLDPCNSDKSHAIAFAFKGGMEALKNVQDFEGILNKSGMLEVEDENS